MVQCPRNLNLRLLDLEVVIDLLGSFQETHVVIPSSHMPSLRSQPEDPLQPSGGYTTDELLLNKQAPSSSLPRPPPPLLVATKALWSLLRTPDHVHLPLAQEGHNQGLASFQLLC